MAQPTFKKKLPGAGKEIQEMETKKAAKKRTEANEQSSGVDSDGKVRLSADISMSNHRKLRMNAADRYISIAQVVDELIDRNL